MSKRDRDNNEFNVFGNIPGLKRAKGANGAPLNSTSNRFQQHRVTIEQTLGDQKDEWKPVEFKKPTRRTSNCFGCEYGMCQPDETQPALQGLWKLFSDNYGKEMSNDELAEVMHVYFDQEIRQPMLAQQHDCPDWTKEQILEHIEVHIMEPTINAGVQIQNMKYIERLLLNQIRLENKDGESKIDLKVLKAVIDTQKQIQTLYNSKPTRQLFYSDYLKLDDRRSNQKD